MDETRTTRVGVSKARKRKIFKASHMLCLQRSTGLRLGENRSALQSFLANGKQLVDVAHGDSPSSL